MSEPAINLTFSGDMQRIQPKSGDIFILKCDGNLSPEVASRLRKDLLRALGDVPVLILGKGMTVEVASLTALMKDRDVAV